MIIIIVPKNFCEKMKYFCQTVHYFALFPYLQIKFKNYQNYSKHDNITYSVMFQDMGEGWLEMGGRGCRDHNVGWGVRIEGLVIRGKAQISDYQNQLKSDVQ